MNAFDIWNYVAAFKRVKRQADRVLARIYDDCERTSPPRPASATSAPTLLIPT